MRKVPSLIRLTSDQHSELELILLFAITAMSKKHRILNFHIHMPIADTKKVISILLHSSQGRRMEIIFYLNSGKFGRYIWIDTTFISYLQINKKYFNHLSNFSGPVIS